MCMDLSRFIFREKLHLTKNLVPPRRDLHLYSRDFNRWRMKIEDHNKEAGDVILLCKFTGERQLAWLENSKSSRRPTDESVG